MEKTTFGYDDAKVLDTRITTETKRLNDLVAAFKKIYEQMLIDRKAHCVDFKSALIQYCQAKIVHNATYSEILNQLAKKLNDLDAAYGLCIDHLADVPMSAIGGMPKKLDMWKKLIKTAMTDKNQSKQLEKIMDLEWQRVLLRRSDSD